MNKIDITSWRSFRFKDLFKIVKGSRLTKANMISGNINYIGATAFNNGVTAKIGNTEHLHPAGTITVCYNGSIGQTFYQTESFWATDDVNVLYPKFEMTPNIAHFFCTVIYKLGLKYGYTDKWTAEKMSNTMINLPSRDNNTPDWNYMEQFVSQTKNRINDNISLINDIVEKVRSRKIKINEWGAFKIGNLFPRIVKPKVYHTREVKENKEGIPYVVRSKFDNGMKYRVSGDGLERNPAGVISFGAENSTFFYQDEEWCSGRDIYFIDTTKLSPYTCKFVISCLHKITSKYSYNYGLFPDLLKNETIMLPKKINNEPDWEYMDKYMRAIEQKAVKIITIK